MNTLDQICAVDRHRRRINVYNASGFKLGQIHILDGRLLAKITILKITLSASPIERDWLYVHEIPPAIRKGHYVIQ